MMKHTPGQHNLLVMRLKQMKKEQAYHVRAIKRLIKEKKENQKDDAAKHS